jgi:hypothetical protein
MYRRENKRRERWREMERVFVSEVDDAGIGKTRAGVDGYRIEKRRR